MTQKRMTCVAPLIWSTLMAGARISIDLISCQNDGKGSTAIAGKVKKA